MSADHPGQAAGCAINADICVQHMLGFCLHHICAASKSASIDDAISENTIKLNLQLLAKCPLCLLLAPKHTRWPLELACTLVQLRKNR